MKKSKKDHFPKIVTSDCILVKLVKMEKYTLYVDLERFLNKKALSFTIDKSPMLKKTVEDFGKMFCFRYFHVFRVAATKAYCMIHKKKRHLS